LRRATVVASIDQTLVSGARPDDEQMFLLVRAACSPGAGFWFPLTDDQFLTGIKIGMRQVTLREMSSPVERDFELRTRRRRLRLVSYCASHCERNR